MNSSSRFSPDIAALESCFVSIKADASSKSKVHGSVAPPVGRFSYSSLIDARSSTPDVSSGCQPPFESPNGPMSRSRKVNDSLMRRTSVVSDSPTGTLGHHQGLVTLPSISQGRAAAKGVSPNALKNAAPKNPSQLIDRKTFITPSTLRENGQEDEHGNVISSICVGLGATGIELFDTDTCNLESIDLGDNKLQFSDAAVFPNVKLLNMYCNGIKSLQHPYSSFKHLEILNISFNVLSSDDLIPLFDIKSLVILDLSYNMISRIPNRWHSLPNLKVLSFEKNSLHHEETFLYLSLAPSLQELNLSCNKLSCVPAACSAPGRFPELIVISLVENRFAHEKDVVALSFVPSIQQVDLWNNPLSTNAESRARSKRAFRGSRSPSPVAQAPQSKSPNTVLHEGFLRVMTPANFEHQPLPFQSSHSPGPSLSFSSLPKRSLADIERDAQSLFRNGMASVNPEHRSLASTSVNLRKLKSILNSSLVGSSDPVILASETTVLNPTLCLIERMKVVGADIERRKTKPPDRFLSHFNFGSLNKSQSAPVNSRPNLHSESIKRMLVAVKQQFRAAAYNGPKRQVVQGFAAMEKTLNEAGAALSKGLTSPKGEATEDASIQKWPAFHDTD